MIPKSPHDHPNPRLWIPVLLIAVGWLVFILRTNNLQTQSILLVITALSVLAIGVATALLGVWLRRQRLATFGEAPGAPDADAAYRLGPDGELIPQDPEVRR